MYVCMYCSVLVILSVVFMSVLCTGSLLWPFTVSSLLKQTPRVGPRHSSSLIIFTPRFLINARIGLSKSFEVDGRVVKVSSQSRDILFKKCHPQRNAQQSSQPILAKWVGIFAGSRLLLTTLFETY